jgi:hypothetical protein
MQVGEGAFDAPEAPPSVIDANYLDLDGVDDEPASSSIGSDENEEEQDHPEALAFVATERISPGDSYARVEMRAIDDGRRAMLAYSSREALVANAGQGQPWTAFPSDHLEAIRDEIGADLILWDPEVSASHRYGAKEGSSEGPEYVDFAPEGE